MYFALVENVELNGDEYPLAFQAKWTDLNTYCFELKHKVDGYIIVSILKEIIIIFFHSSFKCK